MSLVQRIRERAVREQRFEIDGEQTMTTLAIPFPEPLAVPGCVGSVNAIGLCLLARGVPRGAYSSPLYGWLELRERFLNKRLLWGGPDKMKNEVLRTVLTSSVAEHIHAFRALNECSQQDIMRGREALRDWIGTQRETTFKDLGDLGVLSVLLEEFANFAIYVSEELKEENRDVYLCQRGGNA